jgi:hypothetical protein
MAVYALLILAVWRAEVCHRATCSSISSKIVQMRRIAGKPEPCRATTTFPVATLKYRWAPSGSSQACHSKQSNYYHKTAIALQILTDLVAIEPGYSFGNFNGGLTPSPPELRSTSTSPYCLGSYRRGLRCSWHNTFLGSFKIRNRGNLRECSTPGSLWFAAATKASTSTRRVVAQKLCKGYE